MSDVSSYSNSKTLDNPSNPFNLPLMVNIQSLLGNSILTKDNYLIWREQFLQVLATHSLSEIVEKPSSPSADDLPKWTAVNSLILTWIKATISPTLLPLLVGCKTAGQAWEILKQRFSSASKAHVRSLKHELHALKKDPNGSMSDYFLHAKTIANSLAAAGADVSESDLMDYILHGLDSEYKTLYTILTVKPDIKLDDFQQLALQEETVLKQFTALL